MRVLFKYYNYGKHVEESAEEAVKYIQLGALENDPECQFELGRYYLEGRGNLPRSFYNALKYYKSAADLGHNHAQRVMKSISNILHPHVQIADLCPYLMDGQLSTLKSLL